MPRAENNPHWFAQNREIEINILIQMAIRPNRGLGCARPRSAGIFASAHTRCAPLSKGPSLARPPYADSPVFPNDSDLPGDPGRGVPAGGMDRPGRAGTRDQCHFADPVGLSGVDDRARDHRLAQLVVGFPPCAGGARGRPCRVHYRGFRHRNRRHRFRQPVHRLGRFPAVGRRGALALARCDADRNRADPGLCRLGLHPAATGADLRSLPVRAAGNLYRGAVGDDRLAEHRCALQPHRANARTGRNPRKTPPAGAGRRAGLCPPHVPGAQRGDRPDRQRRAMDRPVPRYRRGVHAPAHRPRCLCRGRAADQPDTV